MNYSFFAMVSRMKYIDRWARMRNTENESLDSHSKEVAVIAHALAFIGNKRFGKNYNTYRAAVLGPYHDAHEIITGDMPTPVKYFNPEIRSAYQAAEESACQRLVDCLPEDMREDIAPYIFADRDEEYRPFIKAADKLSALAKCVEERGMGNREFKDAEKATVAHIREMKLGAADVFLDTFMEAYGLTLDELTDRA